MLTQRFSQAHEWRTRAAHAFAADTDLQAVFNAVAAEPRSWVHPGMKQNWEEQLNLAGSVPLHYLFVGRGFPTLGGMLYHAFSLAGDTMFTFDPERAASYDLFGVGTVVAPTSMPVPAMLTERATFGKYRVLTRPAQRLELVDLTFQVAGTPRDLSEFVQRWSRSQLVERRQHGLIAKNGMPASTLANLAATDPLPLAPQRSAAGFIETESSRGVEQVSGKVRLDRPAYLLLKTGYHQNWRATVDGKPILPLRVTPGFLAVALAAGLHTVEFEYVGSRFKVPLLLSSLLTIFGCYLAGRKRNLAP